VIESFFINLVLLLADDDSSSSSSSDQTGWYLFVLFINLIAIALCIWSLYDRQKKKKQRQQNEIEYAVQRELQRYGIQRDASYSPYSAYEDQRPTSYSSYEDRRTNYRGERESWKDRIQNKAAYGTAMALLIINLLSAPLMFVMMVIVGIFYYFLIIISHIISIIATILLTSGGFKNDKNISGTGFGIGISNWSIGIICSIINLLTTNTPHILFIYLPLVGLNTLLGSISFGNVMKEQFKDDIENLAAFNTGEALLIINILCSIPIIILCSIAFSDKSPLLLLQYVFLIIPINIIAGILLTIGGFKNDKNLSGTGFGIGIITWGIFIAFSIFGLLIAILTTNQINTFQNIFLFMLPIGVIYEIIIIELPYTFGDINWFFLLYLTYQHHYQYITIFDTIIFYLGLVGLNTLLASISFGNVMKEQLYYY